MSDIFTDIEIEESPESYNDDEYFSESYDDENYYTEAYNNGNCPPGHFISIQAGGKGHSVGDDCGCDEINPETPIDFIMPILLITGFLLIYNKFKKVLW